MTTPSPEPVARLEELLQRLEDSRARLEQTEDPEQGVEILRELAEVAKEVQVEIERARREGPS
jgi:hypothetical protein